MRIGKTESEYSENGFEYSSGILENISTNNPY